MNIIAELLGDNEAHWMNNPDRPCAQVIDDPTCIREHADSWFPRDKHYDQATQLCSGCPEKVACLKYALDNREEHGVWGGTTPKDRARLVRKAAA